MRLKYPLIFASIVVYMAASSFIGRWSGLAWDNLLDGETLRYALSGVVLALFLIGTHDFSLRKRLRRYRVEFPLADSEPIDSSKLKQKVLVPRSCAETFDLCRESVRTIDGAWVAGADLQKGLIKARTGLSWSTLGERIEFRLSPIGETFTEIEVMSRPLWGTAHLDGGRSLANITSICIFLRDQPKTVHIGELIAA